MSTISQQKVENNIPNPNQADPTMRFSYMILLTFNLFNFIAPMPVSFQLFLSSMACIYIGSKRGIIIQDKPDHRDDRDKPEGMTARDAYMFPVYGSVVLFGLYMCYKIFDKNFLNAVISFHFTIFGFLSLVQLLAYHINHKVPEWERLYVVKRKYKITFIKWSKSIDVAINRSETIAGLVALPPTVLYLLTGHWLLNNLFGVSFSVLGIENMVVPNFNIAFIIMWGLFFYDIFWVYGTDVMLTVAKSVDGPIKLLFPVNLHVKEPAFSMLGLGDIVIPGIFCALCLKYDVDRAIVNFRKRGLKEFDFSLVPTTYFNWSLVGYAIGIILTFNAMVFFEHPQPALLFLVPSCTLAILFCAAKEMEVKELFEYSEENTRSMDRPGPIAGPKKPSNKSVI